MILSGFCLMEEVTSLPTVILVISFNFLLFKGKFVEVMRKRRTYT
jgi:hypothetical protein